MNEEEISYLSLSESESRYGKFKYKHHSTASVIEVTQTNEEGGTSSMWFDYSGFEEFVEFMKTFYIPE